MHTTLQRRLVWVSGIGVAILAACTGEPPDLPIQWTPPPTAEAIQLYQIIDYKTKALAEEIPEWVNLYESEGIPGIEGLPQYEDAYIFVSELEGTNFHALQQWSSGFVLSKDLSRLVASRIQARMTKTAASYPEGEYGRFFEALIKAASDTGYSGAVQEGDFWVLKQYFKEDGVSPDREAYSFLILVSIHKPALQRQIHGILNALGSLPLTKAQTLSVSRLKESFFDFF
ncbi:MAG: hypothetical protein LBU25_08430 [Treponema sp.]|jgi:hypothetical protein|nr:hypothetical protein [Treponema sp.]